MNKCMSVRVDSNFLQDRMKSRRSQSVTPVASVSVVRNDALEAMGVDALDAGNHHCFASLDGLEIVPKLLVAAISCCKAKSYRQLIRWRLN